MARSHGLPARSACRRVGPRRSIGASPRGDIDGPKYRSLKAKEYETIYILRSDVDADTAREGPGARRRGRRPRQRQARQGRGLGPSQARVPGREAEARRLRLREVRRTRRSRAGARAQPEAPGRGPEVPDRPDAATRSTSRRVTVDPEEVKFQRLELAARGGRRTSRARRQLGLIDLGPEAPRSMRRRATDGDDEFADDEMARRERARARRRAAPRLHRGRRPRKAEP